MKQIYKLAVLVVLAYCAVMELSMATTDGRCGDAAGYLHVMGAVSGAVFAASAAGLVETGNAMSTLLVWAFVSSMVLLYSPGSMSRVCGDLYSQTPLGSLIGIVPVAVMSIPLALASLRRLVEA